MMIAAAPAPAPEWHVKLIYAAAVPDDDELAGLLPAGAGMVVDHTAGRVELRLAVQAGGMRAALSDALREAAPVSQELRTLPDAAEVLSERELVDRLGGPDALEAITAWMRAGR